MSKATEAPPAVPQAPPQAVPLEQVISILKLEIEDLRKQVESLRTREAKHWKMTENFLSKFGTYYDTTRKQQALFVVGQFTNGGGVNGLALTPQQGMIEQFALPMFLSLETREAKECKSPCMVPFLIPEEAQEKIEVELFGAENDGTDSKASA